ncbi:4'-phosphopantetheinyl transferase [Gracilibacillus halophilus YIM-C55.5]|uniref:Holo-[acyl-carrier-protein] synthase n=1 Tax=Gracilibacillus halophilus YIM-C55.5 TaxID=1308866 RepID=N4WJP1_9BACI|nr:holo-ACP synthase [Gracilibacillus halophilus]ENH96387.1 4'-phosphopantetheinyl transferase [Gracilibacillus halophilus YIM-C55.5]
MIQGIGIDIIELERVSQMIEKQPKFLDRLFTENEKVLYEQLTNQKRKVEFVSGRFAAKEAFSKAMGTGIGKKLSLRDIEITTADSGEPVIETTVIASGRVFVSISHSHDYAVAQVIIERDSAY